jgi:hypothetical protein
MFAIVIVGRSLLVKLASFDKGTELLKVVVIV